MSRVPRYNPTVLDHYENPRNVGVVQGAEADVTVSDPECGDTLRLSLRIRDGQVQQARFKALGCGAAIASASRLTEILTGLSLGEAQALSNARVVRDLGGLPPGKLRCSVLAEQAVSAALDQYRQGRGTIRD